MTATLLDGKPLASAILEEISAGLRLLASHHHSLPGLAVVGFQGSSEARAYTKTLEKQTARVGMPFQLYELAPDARESEVSQVLTQLNADDSVAGILLETPLPAGLDARRLFDAIDPDKDVDGCHTLNAGRLYLGGDGFVPATPLGGMELLRYYGVDVEGKRAVVIGRSVVVGRPLAMLLLRANATVIICHSKTRDLPEFTRQADILAVAAGQPELVRGHMVKPGACVVDFGANFVGGRLVGDVAFPEVVEVAGAVSPVPGGTGPVTSAVLLKNTFRAARMLLQRKAEDAR